MPGPDLATSRSHPELIADLDGALILATDARVEYRYRLPLFFLIAFSPWTLLTAWQMVYTSTVWTLTYREIKALPAQSSETKVASIPD
jgi:hypothetical protein